MMIGMFKKEARIIQEVRETGVTASPGDAG
jgi:hypothetical protein